VREQKAQRSSLIALGLAAFVVIGAWFAHVTVGFPGTWNPDRFQTYPDAVADWLTTRAAFDRIDPYQPVDDLAAIYGVPVDPLPPEAIHPRFPGAFFVQAPMLAASWEAIVSWMTVVNLLSLAAVGWIVWRWQGTSLLAWTLPVVILSPVFLELMAHGGHVGPLVLLLTGGWCLAATGHERAGGVLVGVMALLRGFPLLLLPALLLAGRRRAAVVGAGVFLGVNLIAMVALGIGAGDAWAGLTAASGLFGTDSHNASLAGLIAWLGVPFGAAAVAGLSVALAWWLWRVRGGGTLDELMVVTIPAMVLASPLSWPSYHLLFLPLAGVMAAMGRRRDVTIVGVAAGIGYVLWHTLGVAVSGLTSAATNLTAAGVTSRRPVGLASPVSVTPGPSEGAP
jgi:hypothetical protein